jgi:hypothetical protein
VPIEHLPAAEHAAKAVVHLGEQVARESADHSGQVAVVQRHHCGDVDDRVPGLAVAGTNTFSGIAASAVFEAMTPALYASDWITRHWPSLGVPVAGASTHPRE